MDLDSIIALVLGAVGSIGGLYAALSKGAIDRGVAVITGYGQLVDDMQARIKGLTAEITRLQAKVTVLESEREALLSRIDELERERLELQRRVAELEAELCRERG